MNGSCRDITVNPPQRLDEREIKQTHRQWEETNKTNNFNIILVTIKQRHAFLSYHYCQMSALKSKVYNPTWETFLSKFRTLYYLIYLIQFNI